MFTRSKLDFSGPLFYIILLSTAFLTRVQSLRGMTCDLMYVISEIEKLVQKILRTGLRTFTSIKPVNKQYPFCPDGRKLYKVQWLLLPNTYNPTTLAHGPKSYTFHGPNFSNAGGSCQQPSNRRQIFSLSEHRFHSRQGAVLPRICASTCWAFQSSISQCPYGLPFKDFLLSYRRVQRRENNDAQTAEV
jgi:hypothetical protein